MAKLGILLYGYDEMSAGAIKKELDELLGEDVTVLSGSGKEDRTVADILRSGPGGALMNNDMKMLMFLGFSGDRIGAAMSGFPVADGIEVPFSAA